MASWWKQESDYDSKNKGHPWTSKSDKNQGSWGHYHKSEGFGKKSSAWQGWHDDSDNEMRSSQTKKKRELDLPVDFKPDSQLLDSGEIYGRKLFKQIQLTNWSQKHGLAGRDVSDVKLFELAYGGWNNFYLRHLSTGAFTTIVFCRKINEVSSRYGLTCSTSGF